MAIKFLNANGLNKKKSIWFPNGRPDDKSLSAEYVTGKPLSLLTLSGDELHFKIISQKADLLKICKTIDKRYKLNGLRTIEDSVRLVLIMVQVKKCIRVVPSAIHYPDPTAPEA